MSPTMALTRGKAALAWAGVKYLRVRGRAAVMAAPLCSSGRRNYAFGAAPAGAGDGDAGAFGGGGGSVGFAQIGSVCNFEAATAVGLSVACPQATSRGSLA